jgi:hypothetical protein
LVESWLLESFDATSSPFLGITEFHNDVATHDPAVLPKAKPTMRKSYGFRTFHVTEIALYHALGKLPEPDVAH